MADCGPYFVFIEKKIEVENKITITKENNEKEIEIVKKMINQPLHPMNFGKFLFGNLSKYNNFILGISAINKFKVRVEFQNGSNANEFINEPKLKENKFNSFIPLFMTTKQGIVKNVPLDIDLEEIKNPEICVSPYRVLDVVRLNRLVKPKEDDPIQSPRYLPSTTIKITFLCQTLPQYITIHSVRTIVEHYIPKVNFCLRCIRWGHKVATCRSRPRCPKCGSVEHEKISDCDSVEIKCIHCENSDHLATDITKCPEFSIQKQIKELMVTKNYSYIEASNRARYHPFSKALTSSVSSSSIPPPPPTYDINNFPPIGADNNNLFNFSLFNYNTNAPKKRPQADDNSNNNIYRKHLKVKFTKEKKSPIPKPQPNFNLPKGQIDLCPSPLPPNPYPPQYHNLNDKNNAPASSNVELMDACDNINNNIKDNNSTIPVLKFSNPNISD